MKIPKTINIAGREIKIEWQTKELERHNHDGEADYQAQKILLNPRKDLDRSNESITVTFIHEIVHWILYVTELEPPNEDQFVGRFAEILYQVIKQLEK